MVRSNYSKFFARSIAIFTLFSILPLSGVHAQYSTSDHASISLNGKWFFCLDPMATGEREKRFDPHFPTNRWDTVTVPHCFSADKRFEFYTGKCWYKRSFNVVPLPAKRYILHFDAAYYRCKIWLNNQLIGDHEGGYTPFKYDVTDALRKGINDVSIQVDNSWNNMTLPGSKPSSIISDRPIDQLFAWINYGGIVRPVYITVEPDIYVSRLKIEADPDLSLGTAQVKFKALVENNSSNAIKVVPQLSLTYLSRAVPLKLRALKAFPIASHSNSEIEWHGGLKVLICTTPR